MSVLGPIWPHDYRALFDLALRETDEWAPGGEGHEGNTVADLYPAPRLLPTSVERRRRAARSFVVLEGRGLVEREPRKRGGRTVWSTTAAGYELVFFGGRL
jgi:hypothetical protein